MVALIIGHVGSRRRTIDAADPAPRLGALMWRRSDRVEKKALLAGSPDFRADD
jgi:hypothetical protein